MKILVYSGPGTGQRAKIQAKEACERLCPTVASDFVDADELQRTEWLGSTCLLVIPGGRDVPYHEHLSGSANENIRRFVNEGGSYLGFCAGAYYGCSAIEFERGGKYEVIAERELCFFKGTAIGPAYGPGTFVYDSDSGARAAVIDWIENPGTFSVYYDGGCYFEAANDFKEYQVLARYADIEGNPASIVECRVGKGRAILSGVHPEFGPTGFGEKFGTPASVIQTLSKQNHSGDSVVAIILARLGIPCIPLPKGPTV